MRDYVIVLLLLLSACSHDERNTYFVRFDKVDNLAEKTKVYCKGAPVGEVHSLRLSKGMEVIAELKVDPVVKVKKGYKFALVPLDFFGNTIEIVAEGNGGDLPAGDTVRGIVINKEPIHKMDSLDLKIVDSLLLRGRPKAR
jgi:ABC-type transporter Mla subunit MlaD